MITNILLGVIALVSLYRLHLVTRKDTVKAHFKAKRDGTQKMAWDLKFKVFKTKEIREDIRKEYDYMKSRIAALDDKIAAEKNKDEKANLKDVKTRAENDLERLEGQINNLDIEISGAKPTNEMPNGHIGLNEQIESVEELVSMIDEYRKGL
jgi:predicted  nucleic acid-binding Zn-ribbon protein